MCVLDWFLQWKHLFLLLTSKIIRGLWQHPDPHEHNHPNGHGNSWAKSMRALQLVSQHSLTRRKYNYGQCKSNITRMCLSVTSWVWVRDTQAFPEARKKANQQWPVGEQSSQCDSSALSVTALFLSFSRVGEPFPGELEGQKEKLRLEGPCHCPQEAPHRPTEVRTSLLGGAKDQILTGR